MKELLKVVAIILALQVLISCGGGGDSDSPSEVVETDTDRDGIPDSRDADDDGDGYADTEDAFPLDSSEWADLDNDGIGDNSDQDRDGDGVSNEEDLFPIDSTESSDLDGDGVGDNSDEDRDGDSVLNEQDAFPDDATESADTDGDGIGDNADSDADGNGIEDEIENYEQEIFDLPETITGITDSVFHGEKRQFYLALKNSNAVAVVDADSGTVLKTFSFDYMAERVELSHDKSTLYVTLLTQEHSSYWWEEEQEGRIAVIDTETLEITDTYVIAIDPFDIVATKDGTLVVSSGSGQWTDINIYDAQTGSLINQSYIRQMSYLSYSPDKNWVIAADTDLSPSDFEKFTVSASEIAGNGDTPYHGDHRIGGRAWINEAGSHILTKGGDVFDGATMEYMSSLTPSGVTIDNVNFDEESSVAFLSLSDSRVITLNLESMVEIASDILFGEVISVGAQEYFTYTIVESGGIVSVVKDLHSCLTCIDNTAPTAEFSITPSSGDTNTTFVFDGEDSTDAESPQELQYRWDFESDGEWDTEFMDDLTFEHKFFLQGTKYVRLQVKDKEGKVSVVTRSVTVEQGAQDPTLVTDSAANSVSFEYDDRVVANESAQAIFLDTENKRVYFSDLEEGKTSQYFEFSYFPKSLSLGSGGKYLYVTLAKELEIDYWSEEEFTTFIAVIDLESGQWINTLEVAIPVHDLVATSEGRLFVTAEGYRNSNVYEISSEDGSTINEIWFDENTELYLSPGDQYLYALDSGSYSYYTDILKIDIGNDAFTQLERRSVTVNSYSAEYWLTSDGENFIASNGAVIDTTSLTVTRWLEFNEFTAEKIVFDDTENLFFVFDGDGKVYYFNQTSLYLISSIDVPSLATDMFVVDEELLLVAGLDSSASEIVRITHPCLTCGENTAPSATYTFTPENGDTADTYVFDAGNTSDAEDIEGLLFRWDAQGDGEFETEFSDSSTFEHQYLLSGSYQPTLQVRDSGGLVSTYSTDIDVQQGEISPTTFSESTEFFLDFDITDSQVDAVNGKIYFTDKEDYKLYIYDIASGETQSYFEFRNKPEKMSMSPDGKKLYVSLLIQDHSYYWWEEDQEGYIAVIDLDNLVWNQIHHINMDPYSIVASDDYLYISSGSGQWTNVGAFDLNQEDFDIFSNSIRQLSELIFAQQNEELFFVESYEIEKYEHDGSNLIQQNRTIYSSNLGTTSQAWLSPDESRMLTAGGQVLKTSDLSIEADLTDDVNDVVDVVFDEINNLFFVLTSDGALNYYNSISFEHIASLDDVSDGVLLFLIDEQLLIISGESGAYSVDYVEHPCLECSDNTAPTASFEVTTEEPSTASSIEFDASLSTDDEDGTDLQYRWDFDNDDVWDTEFSGEATASTSYTLKGDKSVTVQVKDTFGLVDQHTVTFEAVQRTSYGVEVTDSVAYQLETEITDLYFDESRNKLYISDRNAKKLYVVDMESGLTERYFSFDMDVGAIAVTPDETTMYLALLTDQSSSCCWWESEQYGYIATFDLADLGWEDTYEVAIDPFDMVATDAGNLVISSGSGQWTQIKNFDATDGSEIDSASIRHRSIIRLHPDQDMVYAADTDLSPSDIEMFSITSTSITSEGDSPYHGDYRMGGNVWVTPDGDSLISRGGHVFLSSDMTYDTTLEADINWISALTFGENSVTVATNSEVLYQFSLDDFSLVSSQEQVETNFIFNSGGTVYYIDDSGQGVEIKTANLE